MKLKQKPQLEAQALLQIHGLFPKSWLVELVKLKNIGLLARPSRYVHKIKFRNLKSGQIDQTEYPMELPDYNNNSRGLFTGSGIHESKPLPLGLNQDRFGSSSGPWISCQRIFYI